MRKRFSLFGKNARSNWQLPFSRSRTKKICKSVGQRSLRCEMLEDRRMLTTIWVDDLSDVTEGTGTTLREAIARATDNDNIEFTQEGSFQLIHGALSISKDITINEGNKSIGIVAQDDDTRIFDISTAGNVIIYSMGLSGDANDSGGGISNAGTLTLNDVTIANSSTTGNGGAISNSATGSISLVNVSITGCSANSFGGGIYNSGPSPLSLNHVSITGCSASLGDGIYNNGASLSLSNGSLVSSNDGDGIYTFNGDVEVSNSTISVNAGCGIYSNGGDVDVDNNSQIIGNTLGSGIDVANGDIEVINSTVSSNVGYGIHSDGGNVEIVGSEISYNTSGSGIYVANGDLTIGLDGGTDTTTISGNSAANGGGICLISTGADMDVVIRRTTISGNTLAPSGDGGGIYCLDDRVTIDPQITVAVIDSTISGHAADNGGAIYADGVDTFTITGSTISGNAASVTGYGAGIYHKNGNLTLEDSSITTTATTNIALDGGGIYNEGGNVGLIASTISGHHVAGDGGGIYSVDGTVSVAASDDTGSSIINNVATTGNGGGVYLSDSNWLDDATPDAVRSSITGNSAVNGGGIYIRNESADCSMIIQSMFIDSNTTTGNGGGIYCVDEGTDTTTITTSISLRDSTVSNHEAGTGGGIYCHKIDTLDIIDSTISFNNTCVDENFYLQAPGNGGGIYVYQGNLTVTNSTISGNEAYGDPSWGTREGNGGGIYHDSGNLTISDSTISANKAEGIMQGNGGGVYHDNGAMTVSGSTISDNEANGPDYQSNGSGGGIWNNDGDLTITDSNISENTAVSHGGGIYHTNGNLTISGTIESLDTAIESHIDAAGGTWNEINVRSFVYSNGSDSSGGYVEREGQSIISNNRAGLNDNNSSVNKGGGIFCENAASFVVNNTIIADNQGHAWGAGIYYNDPDNNCAEDENTPSDLTVDKSIILGNTLLSMGGFDGNEFWYDSIYLCETLGGGGIYGENLDDFIVTDSTIVGNEIDGGNFNYAGYGAGIYSNNSSETKVDNSRFFENIGSVGPALAVNVCDSKETGTTLTNIKVFENTTENNLVNCVRDSGGILVATHVNVVTDNTSYKQTLTVADTLVHDNYNNYCIAFLIAEMNVVSITRSSIFSNDFSDDSYGNIENNRCGTVDFYNRYFDLEAVITDTNIYSNTVYAGGGLTFHIFDGASYCTMDVEISNCEITDNTSGFSYESSFYAGRAGGILAQCNSTAGNQINIKLKNSTVSDNLLNSGNSSWQCRHSGGSGIYFESSGLLTIENSTISNNIVEHSNLTSPILNLTTGGAGICNLGGSIDVKNSTISGNYFDANSCTVGDGGGIYCSSSESVTITDSNISGNSAPNNGGGIYVEANTLSISGSTIAGNVANSGNNNVGDGGGIWALTNAFEIVNSNILGNSADAGGGIYHDLDSTGTFTVTNSSIQGNIATNGNGGGVTSLNNGNVNIVNSVIASNAASAAGGGIYRLASKPLQVTNSTITGNEASSQGGIYAESSIFNQCVSINNSIVSLNQATVDNNLDSSIHLGQSSNNLANGSNPGFVDFKGYSTIGPGIDTVWGTGDDVLADLHLTFNSTDVVNQGNNSLAVDSQNVALELDLEGKPRIYYDTVDIGALEYYELAVPGNANLDQKVDAADVAIMAANWGRLDATWQMGDFNYDHTVNAKDAKLLAMNWGYTYGGDGAYAPEAIKVVEVALAASGGAAFALPTEQGTDVQLRPLPIGDDMNQVIITFDCQLTSTTAELLGYLTLADKRGAGDALSATGVSISTDGLTATWTFGQSISTGEWVIQLSDEVEADGTSLDGEWDGPMYIGDTSGTSDFTLGAISGDGYLGGDFVFAFSVLPGDANQDGRVDADDAMVVATNLDLGISSGATWADGDFDLDGDVDEDDLFTLSSHWGMAFWQEQSAGVTYANEAPKVTGITVSNSGVSGSAVAIPAEAGADDQLLPLAVFDGMNQVAISFDRPITDDGTEMLDYLTLTDGYGLGTEYSPNSIGHSSDGRTVYWSFADTFQYGEWVLSLSDDIEADGIALDGEWDGAGHLGDTSGTSEFSYTGTSGDGVAGGDFNFSFSLLLPGDANLDGTVSFVDAIITYGNIGMSTGALWTDGDFDDDGDVDSDDSGVINANSNAVSWAYGLQVTKVEVANSGIADSEIFIPTMAGDDVQLMPLPILDYMYNSGTGVCGGIDQIILSFDQPIASSTAELLGYLTLTEVETDTDYSPTSVSLSADSQTVTWTFAEEFQWDRWLMTLSDDIISAYGLPLDGEWDGPAYRGDSSGTSDFWSDTTTGDGTYGGDFEFAFSLLVRGDCNLDGITNAVDYYMFGEGWQMTSGATWQLGDYDFDGDVDTADFGYFSAGWFNPTYWYEPTTILGIEVANSSIANSEIAIPTAVGDDDQLMPLPVFDSVDQVIITFSQPVIASVGDLTLTDEQGAGTAYTPTAVSTTSTDGCTVTWTFDTQFKLGEWVLNVSDSLTDAEGVPIDGEWDGPGYRDDTSSTSTFNNDGFSGDGLYGGDFEFAFSMLLTGDANLDGKVDAADVAITAANWGSLNATWQMGDFNGDGTISSQDMGMLGANWGKQYWPTALMVAGVSVANSGVTDSTLAIPTGTSPYYTEQLMPLPVFDGMDQVIMTFTKPITSSTDDLLDYLTLTDQRGLGTEYSPTSVAISTDHLTVTWTFAQEFRYGEWVMTLSDSIISGSAPLDGDWDGPTSQYVMTAYTSEFNNGGTSGDGDYGGNFVFNFTLLLPGDATMNGSVSSSDASILDANIGMTSGATWEDGDFDFDGDVDTNDEAILDAHYGTRYYGRLLHITTVEMANSSVSGSEISVPTAAGDDEQLRPLAAYDGINQVILTFDFSVGSTTTELLGYLTLTDECGLGTEYSPTSVSLSTDNKTVTWTFGTTFEEGQFVLNLSDEIKDVYDTRLDGEWDGPDYLGDTSGTSQFYSGETSGDGRVGGDFTFAFSLLLPGDANRDGRVDEIDLTIMQANYNIQTGMTWEDSDFNGDGAVDGLDLTYLGYYWGQRYWPAPVPEASSGSVLDALFAAYGFGNDDPNDDTTPEDELWDDFVEDLLEVMGI